MVKKAIKIKNDAIKAKIVAAVEENDVIILPDSVQYSAALGLGTSVCMYIGIARPNTEPKALKLACNVATFFRFCRVWDCSGSIDPMAIIIKDSEIARNELNIQYHIAVGMKKG